MSSDVRLVRQSQLASQISPRLQVVRREADMDDRMFEGRLEWVCLREGLFLHYSDCLELNTFRTHAQIRPCLNVVLFLEGNCSVQYGSQRFDFGPRRCNSGRLHNEVVAVALAEPDLFVRDSRRGAHVRKVVVSLAPEWFESGGLSGLGGYQEVLAFSRRHLANLAWKPSTRLLAMAEQMLGLSCYNGLLDRLHLESRSLEIAAEVLAVIGQRQGDSARALRPCEQLRIRRVVELLDSEPGSQWTLEAIAREVGVNANTLQVQFKAAQGMTIFEYLRGRKLRLARDALERQDVSVAQAAWLAGYSSAANFATAFKRQFGLSPRQVRTRL
ncbi:helix-turn-helix transcriptional regulator [Pseudomonas sp. ABC1]|uniref:helix-turn-helix transcriptional regulator n=1 Tax=Pseudomonas sp. ABC1 TaxID=2748080 RepID=UPI0015C3B53C|nr:AraC family transcriptional regulator [Pseudomonas sp. ABC1]QLF93349.1 helix-turn-helix transcriptional regulator [Pseudomonas sp. ABC1]